MITPASGTSPGPFGLILAGTCITLEREITSHFDRVSPSSAIHCETNMQPFDDRHEIPPFSIHYLLEINHKDTVVEYSKEIVDNDN